MSEQHHKLTDAPPAVQIAVDLIELLEENKIDNKIAVEALEIVLKDYQKKAQVKWTCAYTFSLINNLDCKTFYTFINIFRKWFHI